MRFLLLFLLGCGSEPAPEPPAEPVLSPAVKATRAHMAEHRAKLEEARLAVIARDFEGVRPPMRWLAEHQATALPAGWEPYMADFRAEAKGAVEATNEEELGRSVALVASRCGACHEGLGVKVDIPMPPVPDDAGMTGHMGRHVWASDRMWDSLIFPSMERWEAAAHVMELDDGHELLMPEQVKPFQDRVHSLATAGLRSPTVSARAELYGQMLAACAGCHAVDITPEPVPAE